MKMGIIRESVNSKFLDDEYGGTQKEELIDLALVVLHENMREIELNLLNNAKKIMLDNFRSIKWVYHKLGDLKEKMHGINTNKDNKAIGDHQ